MVSIAMTNTKRLVAAAMLLIAQAASGQVSVFPSAPRAQDVVRVQLPTGAIGQGAPQGFNDYDASATTVSMAANKISVSLIMTNNGFSAPSSGLDLPVGQFPAGAYQVEVTRRLPDGTSLSGMGSATFSVSPRAAADPLWNSSDLWWNPQESGWGLNITHHGLGKIFASWFVYGPDGTPTWYSIPDGQWKGATTYQGTIYRTSGPYFGACVEGTCPAPFDPNAVVRTAVGTGTLQFLPWSSDFASAVFVIDGKTIVKQLRRFSF
jgi:hypothetical protein